MEFRIFKIWQAQRFKEIFGRKYSYPVIHTAVAFINH